MRCEATLKKKEKWKSTAEKISEVDTQAGHSQRRHAAASDTSSSCHSSNYLAVVCQRIPPSRVLRTLTLPLLWGITKVQLLEGMGRVRMKLTCTKPFIRNAYTPKCACLWSEWRSTNECDQVCGDCSAAKHYFRHWSVRLGSHLWRHSSIEGVTFIKHCFINVPLN